MVDIFEEVDEELRRDKYQDLLRKYGPWALGGAVAIVLGAIAWQGFDGWQTGQREAASDSYIAAMTQFEAGNLDLAAAGFETLAQEGTPGYVALALMQRANVALEAGDNATAVDFFEQAAAASNDPLVRDMAEIRAVWAGWSTLSFADIDLRLSPLVSGDTPYRHLARESIAAAALRAGDVERARTQYQFLAFASDAPTGVQRRASEALSLIGQRQAPADEAAGAEAPAQPALEDAAEDAAADNEETSDAGEAGDD